MSDMQAGEPDEMKPAGQVADPLAGMTPGARLAARRMEMGLSVQQVADHLNLAPRQIQAIESDNYAALPGMASVRGFIRAYAKLLNTDPAPLLATIAAEATPLEEAIPLRRALPAKPFYENRLSPAEHGSRSSRVALAVIALSLVAIAVGVLAVQQGGWVAALAPSISEKIEKSVHALTGTRTGNVPVQQATAPATTETVVQTLHVNAAPTPAAAGVASVSAASAPSPSAALPPSAAMPEGQGAGNVSGSANTVSTAQKDQGPLAVAAIHSASDQKDNGADQLQLKFNEDSWLEIKRPDNRKIVSRLVKAGAIESFNISGPVSLTVGNASGVAATLRGTRLDLQGNAKSNVARLELK